VNRSDLPRDKITGSLKELTHSQPIQFEKPLQDGLAEVCAENEALMTKLHHTQEQLEHAFLAIKSNEELLKKQLKYIDRFTQQVPSYWDADSIEAVEIDVGTGYSGTRFILKNAFLKDQYFTEIDFEISEASGVLNLCINRSAQPWLIWFSQNPDQAKLNLTPNTGNAYTGNNAVLSSLGPTDWDLISALAYKLDTHLQLSPTNCYPAINKRTATLKALKSYSHTLSTWPLTPRYDWVKLSDTYQQDNYKSLGLTLENLQIGALRWAKFDYRVATLDQTNETFGTNPRVEISSNMKEHLQNWFPESDDERGTRLELRFAKPSAMDIRVWNALAENDKILMAGLISCLESQLKQVADQNETVKVEWEEWFLLAQTIKQITAAKTNPAASRA
jgi:hypothetical protein